MKRILIVGASDFQLPAIIKAKEMGLYVGVADFNSNAVGIPYADEFFYVSTIDAEGIYQAAKEFVADGIVTLCTDMPMRAIAYACEQLGLKGLDIDSAVRATDKGVMIDAFAKNGVEHPVYQVLPSGNFEKFDQNAFSFPLITKPTDNSGSRGIMKVNSLDELENALAYSSNDGRSGDVIVQEFMQGPEVSVELMVIDGVPNVLQVTDKLTTGAPHFVEIGHSQPSKISENDLVKIRDLAKRAAMAVGIVDGAGHAEIILTKDGPKVVEIGARMGGGCITTHLVPLSTGIDMTKATIQVALGEKPNIDSTCKFGSAIRFIIPPKGKIISISGKEYAETIPGIKLVDIQCEVGQILGELENGTKRIGYVIAQGETVEEAVTICEKAQAQIIIETE